MSGETISMACVLARERANDGSFLLRVLPQTDNCRTFSTMQKIRSLGTLAWKRVSDASVLAWLVSLPVGIIASFWAWAISWGYLPVALTGLGVFVLTIWGFIGIVWLSRQNRPSRRRVSFNYSYGLAIEDVKIAFDKDSINNTLQVLSDLRNHANGPMKFCVTVFRTTAEDRYYECPKQIEGILSRVDRRTIFPGTGFNKEAFDNFKGQPIMGALCLEILYGHPEDGFFS